MFHNFLYQKFNRKIAGRLIFIIGFLLMILGVTFLYASLEKASGNFPSQVQIILFFLLVVAGFALSILAIRLNKNSSYLFFTSFFLMAAILLFISALGIFPLPFSRAWPLLVIFSGIALLLVGWRRCGGIRQRYAVSSGAFVVLGSVMLVFSLNIVPISFTDFIRIWWPLIIVLAALSLFLISISSKGEKKD